MIGPIGPERNPLPYWIDGPAIISVSGGRTSAYMLRCILDAHGGALPENVHAVFANTGREMPATLDFLHDIETHWRVPIVWLEFTARRAGGYRVVDYATAARNGEPFEALLRILGYLPNPVTRACTQELKVRTIKRWCLRALGWTNWVNVVGIRADEPKRLARPRPRERFQLRFPLADAGVTKNVVSDFWRLQSFDLGLAGPWEGNCDGCFLKSRAAIERMILDHPQRMLWWEQMEAIPRGNQNRAGRRFRIDRPGYAELAEQVRRQPRLPTARRDRVLAAIEACGVMCGV